MITALDLIQPNWPSSVGSGFKKLQKMLFHEKIESNGEKNVLFSAVVVNEKVHIG